MSADEYSGTATGMQGTLVGKDKKRAPTSTLVHAHSGQLVNRALSLLSLLSCFVYLTKCLENCSSYRTRCSLATVSKHATNSMHRCCNFPAGRFCTDRF